jgi:hypothetical protein
MNQLKAKLDGSNIDSHEFRKFKTMAHGRNFIEKTTNYTSNLKDKTKIYIGRGSKAGFICKDGLYNQFIDLTKSDGKWTNKLIGDRFLETWKDTSRSEEIEEWMRGKKGMIIRLFVKDDKEPSYICKGIYYYSGRSENGVLWTKY